MSSTVATKTSTGFKTTAGYGSLEVGVSAVESFLRLYLLIYYTDRVGVDPKWAGLVVALGVLWDAVMDPIVGVLCDRTSTRFGRRLPWIMVSSPLFAISVFAAFAVPMGLSDSEKIVWLCLANIAVNTSMAALSIPHLALGSEISQQADVRTKLYAWRMLMSVVGLFVGVAVPAFIRTNFASLDGLALTGFFSLDSLTALAFSGLIVLTSGITLYVFLPKARVQASAVTLKADKASPPFKDVLSNLKRLPFVMLFVGYTVATFGQGLNSSLALYYYKYCLAFTEGQLQSTLLVFMLVLIVSLPLWVAASRRHSKSKLLAIGVLGLGLLTATAYPLLPKYRLDLAMLVGGLGGLTLGCIALFESHLTDMMAHYQFGEQSNASVFGIWKFLAKSARAAAIALSGSLLSFIGYSATAEVSIETSNQLAFIFGPVVGVFFILGGVALWKSRI